MKLGPITLFKKKLITDGVNKTPLMIRYILFRVPAFGIYLHKFMRSDYDRSLHDHPWPFVSLVLTSGYHEIHDQTTNGEQVEIFNAPGRVLVRPAEWRHRVIMRGKPAWTIILVGRRSRWWGFFLPGGWCYWRKHNPEKNICEDVEVWEGGND